MNNNSHLINNLFSQSINSNNVGTNNQLRPFYKRKRNQENDVRLNHFNITNNFSSIGSTAYLHTMNLISCSWEANICMNTYMVEVFSCLQKDFLT